MFDGEGLTFYSANNSKTTIDGQVNINVSGGNDFLFHATLGTEVNIGGNFNLTNTTSSADTPNAQLLIDSSSMVILEGNLNISSNTIDKPATVMVTGSTSVLDVNQDINFVASSEGDVILNVNNQSTLYLAGNVEPAPINDYGSILMEADAEMHFDGNLPQSIPGDDIPGNGTDGNVFSNVFLKTQAIL